MYVLLTNSEVVSILTTHHKNQQLLSITVLLFHWGR